MRVEVFIDELMRFTNAQIHRAMRVADQSSEGPGWSNEESDERARELLKVVLGRAATAEEVATTSGWSCGSCGLFNSGNYTSCYQCGRSR